MPTMIASDNGITYGLKSGVATVSPSIAPSTVIAGVIMPSPYSSAAPKMASSTSTGRPSASRPATWLRPRFSGSSVASARMPPSPWLSARITMAMYLTDTTIRSA